MQDDDFWTKLDSLVGTSSLRIDRPRGSSHPRYPSLVYPLDYGYLEGTRAGDGDGIDVWVGTWPEKRVTGIVCTVDMAKRDSEVKILLGCTHHEAQTILDHHNHGLQSAVLLKRPETQRILEGDLSTQQTLALLQAAMQNELDGEEFFRQAAAESRQVQAKTLFEWLAEQEVDHYRRVKLEHDALAAGKGWQDASPLEGLTIFPTDKQEIKQELADLTGEADAFKMARQFEEKSYDIYRQAIDQVEDELGKKVLRQLADEERRHLELVFEWLTFHLLDPHTPAHDYRRGHSYKES